jgi:hypothetical protein
VSGGTISLADASTSNLTISGGRLNFDTGQTFPNLTLSSSGQLGGSGTVTVTDTLTWTGGSMLGSGKTVIAPGATASISNATNNSSFHESRVLENAGTVTHTAVNLFFNLSNIPTTARIVNLPGAVWESQGEADFKHNFAADSVFENAGIFRKTGAGTTQFTSSQIRFENTGTLRIEGGVLQALGGFTQSGIIEGTGTLQASFTNDGILRPDPLPGPGLTISGNLIQGAAGRIELTLAGRDPSRIHRSLTVTGSATLAGTLALDLQHPFAEGVGESFEVFSFASRSGDFSAVEGLLANSGYDFSRGFTASAQQLTVLTQGDLPAPAVPLAFFDPALASTDSDGDGLSDLLEHAFGCAPDDPASRRSPSIEILRAENPDEWIPAIRYWERSDGLPVIYTVEYSTDLASWSPADGNDGRPGLVETSRATACPVADVVVKRLSHPVGRGILFLRVSVAPRTQD